MFRTSPGFQARYHYLTLMVVLDFDHWKVLMQGPGVLIDGGREHNQAEAERRAREIAETYIQEKHETLPALPNVEWTPLAPGACLTWQA